jgi:hypothetical protein
MSRAVAAKSQTIRSSIFEEFIKKRKLEKYYVHNFQVRQEKVLAMSSTLMTFVRRKVYQLMNKSHKLQNLIWINLLYKYQNELQR